MAILSYAESGVNRTDADRLVEKISILSKATLNRRVKAAVGGYASLFELDKKRWLAASTDGVGTKLKLAFQLNQHRTVGIDLVAMSVNDLLCVGAEPLFFLDYLATGKLNLGVAEQVLEGIVDGCKQARCALVGGETAEMPDFYTPGEYDLAGFAVGVVHPSQVLPKKEIRPGDVLIGLRSSGCHSNGFSLLRKLVSQDSSLNPDSEHKHKHEHEHDPSSDLERTRASRMMELLTPTRIYAKSLLPLLQDRSLKGLAHITGSGFLNLPRLSEKVSYRIELPPASQRPAIFQWIENQSGLTLEELAQTFNLGIGMILAVSPQKSSTVLKKLKRAGELAWVIGEVVKKRPRSGSEVFLRDGENSVTLSY